MADQSNVPPAAPATRPAPAKPHKRRRWPWILAGVIVFLLLVVALLPTILSTGPFRRMVLGRVNAQLNGKADVASWSLGWFSGFKLNGIRVTDAQGNTVAEVKSVTLPASLSALLGSRKNIGALTIEGPKADIVLYADGTNNLTKLMKPPAAPPPAKEAQPLGFDLAGSVAVRNGEITVHPAGGAKPFLIRDLSADVKIESLEKPIQLDAKAALGEERAPLTVNGAATVLHNGKPDPSAVEAKVAVALTGLDLAPLSAVARQYGAPVQMTGNVTANLSAQVKGQNTIAADGEITLKQLSFSGGPLGKDQPKFDQVTLGFDVAKAGQALTIKRFEFTAPVCTADVSGSLEPQAGDNLPKGSLAAHATLTLPALAAQLPDTLRLQQGLTIESGALQLDFTLASDEKGPRLAGSIGLQNLAAVRQGRRIALDAPISLAIQASQSENGPRLDKLELISSFAHATGSGTADKFDLEATSDLAAAMHEAAKFVDLTGKTAQGQAKLTLHASGADLAHKEISGDATVTGLTVTGFTPGPVLLRQAKLTLRVSGADPQRRDVSGDAEVAGLSLTGFTPAPIQLSEAKATLAATAMLDASGAFQKVSGLKLGFSAENIADGGFAADGVALVPGQMLPALTNATAFLNADLAEVARFARAMNLMPAAIGLGGKVICNAGLTADQGAIRLGPVAATLTDLDVSQVVAQGDKKVTRHVREPKVTLTGSAEVNPLGRSAGIHDLTCRVTAGTLTMPSLDIPNWAAAPAGITATLKADLDLERLLASLKDFAPLPEGTKVAGQTTFTLTATTAAAMQQVAVQAAVNGLKVASATGPTVEEDKLTMDGTAVVAPGAASVSLSSLTVASSFFNFSVKGALNDWVKLRDLTADGKLQCNWDKIGALAAAFSGQPVEMSGKDSRDFHVHIPLGAKDLRAVIEKTDAAAGLQIARLKVMGIEMTGISGQVTVKDNVPAMRIEAGVNGGTLLVPARVDWSKLLPELVLPPDTVVLKDVKLTSEMADLGLSRLSPIFKGCTAAGGLVSLDSHLLDVQLGRAVTVGKSLLQRADFEGGLTFSNVSMQSKGVLQSVLELAGSGGQLLSLPNQRVTIALRDGRVVQGPMEIAAGTYRFKVSGSVGLADKTLDYAVELPVSAAMVGNRDDIYQLLKGEVVSISIKGTTDNPEIGKDAFATNLKRLVTAAGKKLVEKEGKKLLQKGVEKGLQNLFK